VSGAHKHYWVLVGKRDDRRWRNGHALARCRRCDALTVVEYGSFPYGPCSHVVKGSEVPTTPLPSSPAELFSLYKRACAEAEAPVCIHCQAPRDGPGVCRNCGR